MGESAPIWVPDERVTMCQKCHNDFTLIVRRHHCRQVKMFPVKRLHWIVLVHTVVSQMKPFLIYRACGKVVCALCSANRAPLKYRGYEASRVCDQCYDELLSSEHQRFIV